MGDDFDGRVTTVGEMCVPRHAERQLEEVILYFVSDGATPKDIERKVWNAIFKMIEDGRLGIEPR